MSDYNVIFFSENNIKTNETIILRDLSVLMGDFKRIMILLIQYIFMVI